MKILQISTYDRAGGAEKVALDLHRTYKALGHDARLLVRDRRTDETGVVALNPYTNIAPWGDLCAGAERSVAAWPRFRGQGRLQDLLRRLALPQRLIDAARGVEDFNYPASHAIASGEWRPDLVHAHNLHGDFFDLRALAEVSAQVPVIWTLHDAWAMTGHCAYPISCERWRTGCGNCPDLRRPPAIARDATAENWARKAAIYAQSRLAVATPSQWLMGLVEASMVQATTKRVIPYGIDRTIFQPGDRAQARAELGLPPDAFIAVFVAMSVKTSNAYKDITTVLRAIAACSNGRELCCIGIGGDAGAAGGAVRYTGYLADPRQVARYYQAADLLLHAANADNFPCVVLEALACGTPVLAAAVGGVPEQIRVGETGILVPVGDWAALSAALVRLVEQPQVRAMLRQGALAHSHAVRSLEQHAADYLDWFGALGTPSSEATACTVV